MTNNTAAVGGSIAVNATSLTLNDTAVTLTQAPQGGGISAQSDFQVALVGTSRVASNTVSTAAGDSGGFGWGILAQSNGTVTLRDTSAVSQNLTQTGGRHRRGYLRDRHPSRRQPGQRQHCRRAGGGIYLLNASDLQLFERSQVITNSALGGPSSGGDIYADPPDSSAQILNQALVTGNTPDNCEPTVGTCTEPAGRVGAATLNLGDEQPLNAMAPHGALGRHRSGLDTRDAPVAPGVARRPGRIAVTRSRRCCQSWGSAPR